MSFDFDEKMIIITEGYAYVIYGVKKKSMKCFFSTGN